MDEREPADTVGEKEQVLKKGVGIGELVGKVGGTGTMELGPPGS
jgi:hypothetical protein